ncbi:MAG: glycosyltransferase family 2 protein [Saprospiraceae bacterium]
MIDNILVSVVLPVYNCSTYIDEAVQSIISQTHRNIELLIIDDSSIDGTTEKLSAWERLDNRVRSVRNETNSGEGESRSRGIRLAKGDFIAFMDGDDISFPDRIEKQLSYLIAHPEIDVLGTGCQILGQEKTITLPSDHEAIAVGFLLDSMIVNPTTMFRAVRLKQITRLYLEPFAPALDYEFFVYLLGKGFRFANLSDILLYYRIHGSNISITKYDNLLLARKQITTSQISKLYPNASAEFIDFLLATHYSSKFVTEEIKDKLPAYLSDLKYLKKINNNVNLYDKLIFGNFVEMTLQKTFKMMRKKYSLSRVFLIRLLYSLKVTKRLLIVSFYRQGISS